MLRITRRVCSRRGRIPSSKIAILQVEKSVSGIPQDPIVQLIQASTSNGQSFENDKQLCLNCSGSSPTEKLPSTTDTPSFQRLLYVVNHTRCQQTTMAECKQLTAEDRYHATNCLGSVSPRKHIICYHCYEIDSNISPECLAELNKENLVVHNHEKFTDEQKRLAPADSYILANEYFEMKGDVAIGKRYCDEHLKMS